jgi:hypothetical protein
MAKNPADISARWAQGLGQAGDRIRDGVMGVTVAPGQAAAAQKATWVQNTTASADKWAANTGRVTKEEWQQAMIEKGVGRIAQGAQAAVPKFETFMGKLLPYQDTLKRSLPQRGNLEANITRMNAWTRGMAKFKNR